MRTFVKLALFVIEFVSAKVYVRSIILFSPYTRLRQFPASIKKSILLFANRSTQGATWAFSTLPRTAAFTLFRCCGLSGIFNVPPQPYIISAPASAGFFFLSGRSRFLPIFSPYPLAMWPLLQVEEPGYQLERKDRERLGVSAASSQREAVHAMFDHAHVFAVIKLSPLYHQSKRNYLCHCRCEIKKTRASEELYPALAKGPVLREPDEVLDSEPEVCSVHYLHKLVPGVLLGACGAEAGRSHGFIRQC
jgi:hypothetical protein